MEIQSSRSFSNGQEQHFNCSCRYDLKGSHEKSVARFLPVNLQVMLEVNINILFDVKVLTSSSNAALPISRTEDQTTFLGDGYSKQSAIGKQQALAAFRSVKEFAS